MKVNDFGDNGIVKYRKYLSKVCDNKLYGSDKDKLKQNLSRLYRLSSLSAKERAEMLKGVENARGFFKETGNATVSKILDELELKLNR